MKVLTSFTIWNDAVGKRISITYSEIDASGRIISDNKRIDRVLTDQEIKTAADNLAQMAQALIEEA